MLRSFLRRPRTVRVPIKNGSVDVQRVEVKRQPKPLFTRFFATFFISYCVIQSATYLLSDEVKRSTTIVSAEVEKAKKAESTSRNATQFGEHWAKQHHQIATTTPQEKNAVIQKSQNEAQSIRLMLPIWFRQKQEDMYKESDPEWKAFADLQQDKKRVSELKKDVAKMVGKHLGRPQHVVNLRHIQYANHIGVYLEVVPPIYPPETFEVPCMFVTPTDVTFGWCPLPEATGSKMERIFHPVIFARAFYTGMREFAIASFLITKARLIDRYNETTTVSINVQTKKGATPNSAVRLPKAMTEEQKANMRFPTTRAPERDLRIMLPFLRGEYGEEGSRQKYRDLVKSMTYQNAIEHACSVFNHKWIASQFAALQKAPRGACQIRGHVDCIGARGRYRLEVVAVYLPSENAIVGRPVITGAFVIVDLPKWAEKKDVKTIAHVPSKTTAPAVAPADHSQHSDPTTERPSDSKDIDK